MPPKQAMNDPLLNTLEEWNRRVSRATWAHHQASIELKRFHYAIGIPLVVITATVGAVGGSGQSKLSYLVAPLSVIAAVLAGLQTFLGFGERAEAHKKAGNAYAAIRREIEHMAASPTANSELLQTRLDEIRARMDSLPEQCSSLPGRIWKAAERKYDRGVYKSTLSKILPPSNC